MASIRVGILGLSPGGPGEWAPEAHFPYLQASPDYEIVAVCNSSVVSSQKAIKVLGLPASTRAYGDPEDLAKDQDVDLVVCTTRVDKHFISISPSLRAGKDVYVEWPLGRNSTEAKELLRLKNLGGVKKATVGLQGRQAPIIKKLKELVEGGTIGKVLSSTFVGQGGSSGEYIEQGTEYFATRSLGGNLVTIRFAHLVDYFQQVLGYGFTSHHSLLANCRPEVKYLTLEGDTIGTYAKDTDDNIFLIGTLSTGVHVSFSLRGGSRFKGAPGLDWHIYGQTGEIHVTADGTYLPVGEDNTKILVSDFEKGTVEEVAISVDEIDELGIVPRNVARVYKAFKKGEINCSFEDAVQRHEFIAELYRENGYFEG